jgi:hypothetical protein
MSTSPWRPSRPVTILIGFLTLLPIIYFIFFFILMFSAFASVGATSGKGAPFDMFRYIFPLHLGAMLLMVVLMAVYIVHAFRTDRIPDDRRVVWVIILFMGNMIAFPIYWYLYLWRAPSLGAVT